MRLTLRTLLAYLDDILEPADAEVLGAKIRESDFAGGLIHRIRNSVGRLRLSSPQLLGKGLGADANTVAEYLDNELPSERVPDFEKVCLESDVHLAEVASCHEILTLVLGEAANVEPTLRQRVYALNQAGAATGAKVATTRRIDAAVASRDLLSGLEQGASAETDHAGTTAGREDVDTSRRTSAGIRWALAGLLLTLAAALVIWRLSPTTSESSLPLNLATLAPDDGQGETPPATVVGDVATPSAIETPGQPVGEASELEPGPEPSTVASNPPSDADPASLSMEPAPPAVNEAAVPDASIRTNESAEPTRDVPVGPPIPQPTVMEPEKVIPAESTEAVPRLQPIQRRYPDQQPLAVWQQEQGIWRLMEAHDPVLPGQSFLAPALFQAELLLGDELEFASLGPARWTIPGDASQPWQLPLGRFQLSGKAGTKPQFEFSSAGHVIHLDFTEPASVVDLEIRPESEPGVDPLKSRAETQVRIWVRTGEVSLRLDEGTAESVRADNLWWMNDQGRVEVRPELAPIAMSESLREIDLQARRDVSSQLVGEPSLQAALMSGWHDRRSDVRSLAARGLAALGVFEPLIETFRDPKYHAAWQSHFLALQEACHQGPESAGQVQKALLVSGGPDGQALYRMLWGYRSDQLRSGDARKLVNYLESPSLPIRVFALESLREITGSTARYRPDYHSNRRKESVRSWQRRLQNGEIDHPLPVENGLPTS